MKKEDIFVWFALLISLATLILFIIGLINTANSTFTEMKDQCVNQKWIWIEEWKECETWDKEWCNSMWGVFNECASACRNNPEAEICTMKCIQVCEFPENL